MTQSNTELRRDRLLDDTYTLVVDVLRELNIDVAKCEIAAEEVTAMFVKKHGGEQVYIPTDHKPKNQERALEIYEACNGRNHAEVGRRFDISARSVYRIYKRIRAQVVAQNQSDLFNSH